MQICITAVKNMITAFGNDYAVYLVSFVDDDQISYPDQKLWCSKKQMCVGRKLNVRETAEGDFQEH